MAAEEEEATRWLLLYGAHLFPSKLKTVLGDARPVSSASALVPDAFLAFSLPGIPFLEPCYASALVRGYNDTGAWEGLEKDGRGGGEYKRWVWERCCPGMEYTGEMPPALEGIVYELGPSDFSAVVSRACETLPTLPTDLVTVSCTRYTDGDPAKTLGDVEASMLVAKGQTHAAGLHPSLSYLALIVRGAHLNTLSRTFLSHLTLLRPFDPTPSPKPLLASLIRVVLLPSFLVFHLPARVLGLSAWGKVGSWLTGRSVRVLRMLEERARRWTGSGYANEGRVKGTAGM